MDNKNKRYKGIVASVKHKKARVRMVDMFGEGKDAFARIDYEKFVSDEDPWPGMVFTVIEDRHGNWRAMRDKDQPFEFTPEEIEEAKAKAATISDELGWLR